MMRTVFGSDRVASRATRGGLAGATATVLAVLVSLQGTTALALVQAELPAPRKPGPELVRLAQVTGPSVGPVSRPAEADSTGGRPTPDYADSYGGSPTAAVSAEDILTAVRQVALICRAVQQQYRVDCLAKEFDLIADSIPKQGDFAAAGQAISQASRKLGTIASGYLDETQQPVRVFTGPEIPRERAPLLNPVKPEAVAAANALATDVLEDTVTVLLRSSEVPRTARADYQDIAEAVETSIVLLRS